MKQAEQITKLHERVTRLESKTMELEAHRLQDGAAIEQAVASAADADHERNWLEVYGHVLGALVAGRRAVVDAQIAALEALAVQAADRACGPRKGGQSHG